MPQRERRSVRAEGFVRQVNHSLSLVQRFAIIGTLATIVLASTTGFFVSQYLIQRDLNDISNKAAEVVSHLITPMVTADNFIDASIENVTLWGERLEDITDVSNIEHVRVWGPDGTIIYATDESLIGETFVSSKLEKALSQEKVLGFVPKQSTGDTFFEVYIPVIPEGADAPIGIYEVFEDFAPIAAKMNRTTVLIWLSAYLIFGLLFFALFATLTASRQQYIAFHDPLTGLANRHFFQERAQRALNFSRRRDDAAAIVYMDLSRFKAINDSLGHGIGDDILKQVAGKLKRSVRLQDTVARIGGDEFAILLTDIGDGERAISVVKRIREQFKEPFGAHQQAVHLDVNIGIALLSREESQNLNVDTWLSQADTAMLHSKDVHNEFQIYNPEMQSYTLERLQLEEDLRKALDNNELTLYYQPLLNGNNFIVGAEALLRWHHGTKGMVSPAQFIPLAEETGLIRELDKWVIRRAIKQASVWMKKGTAMQVSINVSPQSFNDEDFVPYLANLIHHAGVDPSLLTIEITEYVLASPESSSRTLAALKELGLNIALDDFGKGYSSLAYLEALPIDRIKIDMQFIKGIGERPTSEAIIKTILALTENLGIDSLAEGIETAEQLNWLKAQGCRHYQGYLLGRPVPIDKFHPTALDDALERYQVSALN